MSQRQSVSSEADSQVPGVGGWPRVAPWGRSLTLFLCVRLGMSQGGASAWVGIPVHVGA